MLLVIIHVQTVFTTWKPWYIFFRILWWIKKFKRTAFI